MITTAKAQTMINPDDTDPTVWVGCLACYNDGELRGEWVDATDAGAFIPCHGRGHEEWWVFDYQGFGGLLDGECSPIEAQRIAEVIEGLGSYQPVEAFAAWCSNHGETPSLELVEDFAGDYQGEYRSEEEFAEQLADDLGMIPAENAWPMYCIDWERAARELFSDGYWSAAAPGGLVYVFSAS